MPYDFPWSFEQPFLNGLQTHRALRLLGKFIGKDPSRLSELSHVEYLAISRYPRFAFDLLAGFRALGTLELDFLALQTLDGIERLQLRVLSLTELRKLENIDAIGRLPLIVLRLALCNRIRDYDAIGDLRLLERLDIEAKEVNSLAFLQRLKTLRRLGLAVDKTDSNVVDAVSSTTRLERLGIRRRLLGRSGLDHLQKRMPSCAIAVW